jgi:hypothetical protein
MLSRSALLFDMTAPSMANGRRCYLQQRRCSVAVPPLLFDNSIITHKLLITLWEIDQKIQHNSNENKTSD